MMARPHQRYGWLYLTPGDWRACLDRQIQERDRMNDATFSGPPPAWIQWVDSEQMPRLAQHAHYQRQFHARLDELQLKLANLEKQIAAGRLDLEPAAGQTRKEMRWLEGLLEVCHA
jgi:hypothetical protein